MLKIIENNSINCKLSSKSLPSIPKISVIIPTFNKSSYLSKLLPSILKQDYESDQFEVIIVDDGSTDDTAVISQKFINYFKNYYYVYQNNQGIGAARNTGLKLSRGELISFLADDYELHSSYLSKLSSAFTNENVYGIRPLFTSAGRTPVEMAMHMSLIGQLKMSHNPANQMIYKSPYVLSWGGASMTRKSIFEHYGPFLEKFSTGEDTDYGYRLAQSGIHIHIYNEVLFSIKNRRSFFEASRRQFEYSFNGAHLISFIKKKEGSNYLKTLNISMRPLPIRLLRMIVRPLQNCCKYNENYIQAIFVLPIAYCILAASIVGTLWGKFTSKY